MKKILFLIFLIGLVFLIYLLTIDHKIYYVSIGDSLANGTTPNDIKGYGYSDYIADYLKKNNRLKGYSNEFSNNDYRVTDLNRMILSSETKLVDNKTTSLQTLINKADLITISVGQTELYYKLNTNKEHIYEYIDQVISDMDQLLGLVRKYNEHKVFVIGYYNYQNNQNNDLFVYANESLKKVITKYNCNYVNVYQTFKNNVKYFSNPLSFNPNLEGYEEIAKKIIEKLKKQL